MSDDTKRWSTNPVLAAERERALVESSSLRRRPPPPPSGGPSGVRKSFDALAATRQPPMPRAACVDPVRVRRLYDQYMLVMGPVAKAVFETELRALGRLPSTLSAHECELLVERLTARIPVTSARGRFLAAVHDVFA